MFTSVTNEGKMVVSGRDWWPPWDLIWWDSLYPGQEPDATVCNHAFSPFHQITPTRCLKKRMGKLMTTMKYLHFSRAGKNNEQEMWQPQLSGGAKSSETAPAAESCWEARGCQAGWKNGRWQGQHFFFFLMLQQTHRSSAKKTNCRSNFVWKGKFVSI